MAMADYYLCDICESKCFYDANLNWEWVERDGPIPEDEMVRGKHLRLGYCGDMAAICLDCAKTHEVRVVEIAAPQPVAPKAECTNSDSWNCKYCNKTKECEALKDPRNFAAPNAEQPPVQEPFGWYTEDHLTDKSATTYDKSVADRWRAKGWPVHPLYKTPQPASDDALMSAVEDVIDHLNGGFSIHSGQGLHSCLEAAYRAAMGSKGE